MSKMNQKKDLSPQIHNFGACRNLALVKLEGRCRHAGIFVVVAYGDGCLGAIGLLYHRLVDKPS